MSSDPYLLSAEHIQNPPLKLAQRIKYLGPSLILSASIVGSGELIATTTLGAKAGFTCLWLILLSCICKVMIQLEFARNTLNTGKTAMQIIADIPGPRIYGRRWSLWLVLLIMLLKMIQLGGIAGGAGIALHLLFPYIQMPYFVYFVAIVAAYLVQQGLYRKLESLSIYMIAFFTVITFMSLILNQFTSSNISFGQLISGFTLQIPPKALAFAFGAFGITGVGADEIIHYNYWCLEKGYAAYIGPPDSSPQRAARLRGWTSVMKLDAFLAMLIYSTVTGAFYLLGAAILHGHSNLPEGYQVVQTLSNIYTQSLGSWAQSIFYMGAFVILFSTVFAALAAWIRQFTDIFGVMRWFNFSDTKRRAKINTQLAWLVPLLWATLFVFIKLPVLMVLTGGMVGTVLLLLLLFVVVYYKYFATNKPAPESPSYNLLFWLSYASILMFCSYGLWLIATGQQ
jgi:manganese transport protein